MPLHIIRDDITRLKVDAIVNATDRYLSGSGGVDERIQNAAGPGLETELRARRAELTGPGDVLLTGAYDLPARYILHTTGPVWRGGSEGEKEALKACYLNALTKAEAAGCETVAFPVISSGTFGVPPETAVDAAVSSISAFLEDHEITVYLVVYSGEIFAVSRDLYGPVVDHLARVTGYRPPRRPVIWPDRDEYLRRSIPDRGKEPLGEDIVIRGAFPDIVDAAPLEAPRPAPERKEARDDEEIAREKSRRDIESTARERKAARDSDISERPARSSRPSAMPKNAPAPRRHEIPPAAPPPAAAPSSLTLEDLLRAMDEGFSRTLLKLIDEKGVTDVQCYKRSNIDRKLFSRIRSDPHYRPTKLTALAFAVGLKLTVDETNLLLGRAGYVLSNASKLDIIVGYFLDHRQYNIFLINEVLFAYDLPTLGSQRM
ncbi:MAG: macro domain-containing protein [Clostridia bacterium]|nr:macro domain-containing protein [Clostridia bacterium]